MPYLVRVDVQDNAYEYYFKTEVEARSYIEKVEKLWMQGQDINLLIDLLQLDFTDPPEPVFFWSHTLRANVTLVKLKQIAEGSHPVDLKPCLDVTLDGAYHTPHHDGSPRIIEFYGGLEVIGVNKDLVIEEVKNQAKKMLKTNLKKLVDELTGVEAKLAPVEADINIEANALKWPDNMGNDWAYIKVDDIGQNKKG